MSFLKNVGEGFEKLDQMVEDAKKTLSGEEIEETEDEYIVKVNLPNVKKEDVEAHIKEGVLKVHTPAENALCSFPFLPHLRNIRNISIPLGADVDTATATFENSVLRVAFKKMVSARWHKVIVE
jgi:HSP20 family molecular chaperone IbpA